MNSGGWSLSSGVFEFTVTLCICVFWQHGYIEDEPDQRGLFPSSFVQLMSEWHECEPAQGPTRPWTSTDLKTSDRTRRTRTKLDQYRAPEAQTPDPPHTRSGMCFWAAPTPRVHMIQPVQPSISRVVYSLLPWERYIWPFRLRLFMVLRSCGTVPVETALHRISDNSRLTLT